MIPFKTDAPIYHWPIATLLLMLALLVCPVHAQERPAPRRFESLLLALDSPSFRIRQRAERELICLGKPALTALERYIPRAPSLHARMTARRIRKAIRKKLRWAQFRGGPIVAGLQATLRSEKDCFILGEGIRFELEIRNVSKAPITLVRLVRLDWSNNIGPTSQSNSCSWSEGRFTIDPLIRVGIRGFGGHRGSRFNPAGEPNRSRILLAPGKSWRHWISIKSLGLSRSLRPGAYKVRLTYYARQQNLVIGALKDLTTNRVGLEIKARPTTPSRR